MRKITALLLATAALGATAQAAAADVAPEPDWSNYSTINYGNAKQFTCHTRWLAGVQGQGGAWGDFIDGCTVSLSCPSTSKLCTAQAQTSIQASNGAARVTQNTRLSAFTSSGQRVWFHDTTCGGNGMCQNHDAVRIHGTQNASVQCNGVREHVVGQSAYNTCSILVTYEW